MPTRMPSRNGTLHPQEMTASGERVELRRRRAAPLERPHAKPRQEPLLEYAREVLKDRTMPTINARSRRIASFGLPRPHVTVGETHARCASGVLLLSSALLIWSAAF